MSQERKKRGIILSTKPIMLIHKSWFPLKLHTDRIFSSCVCARACDRLFASIHFALVIRIRLVPLALLLSLIHFHVLSWDLSDFETKAILNCWILFFETKSSYRISFSIWFMIANSKYCHSEFWLLVACALSACFVHVVKYSFI